MVVEMNKYRGTVEQVVGRQFNAQAMVGTETWW